MNWRGCGKKWSHTGLRYSPDFLFFMDYLMALHYLNCIASDGRKTDELERILKDTYHLSRC
jgi:hypothetical protein